MDTGATIYKVLDFLHKSYVRIYDDIEVMANKDKIHLSYRRNGFLEKQVFVQIDYSNCQQEYPNIPGYEVLSPIFHLTYISDNQEEKETIAPGHPEYNTLKYALVGRYIAPDLLMR